MNSPTSCRCCQLALALAIVISASESFAQVGQATGQGKIQLFPETETDFFLKVVDAQITFVKDAAGKVNGIVLHQGGANLPGKRVQ